MENRALPYDVKVERRIIEKNRRNQMKFLFHKLHSVIPSNSSQEALPVVDQVDEAIKHIKFLQTKVSKSMEKKQSLMGKKRSSSCSNLDSRFTQKSPQIKIHEMGSALEVFLTSGVDNKFMLQEIIQILHQERAEIVHVCYSVVGNSVFHTVHAEMKDAICYFGASKITEKLNTLVYGSISDVELQPEWVDFNYRPDDCFWIEKNGEDQSLFEFNQSKSSAIYSCRGEISLLTPSLPVMIELPYTCLGLLRVLKWENQSSRGREGERIFGIDPPSMS